MILGMLTMCSCMCKCVTPTHRWVIKETYCLIHCQTSSSCCLFLTFVVPSLCLSPFPPALSHFLPWSLRHVSRSVSVSSVLLKHHTSSLLLCCLFSISTSVLLWDSAHFCCPPTVKLLFQIFRCSPYSYVSHLLAYSLWYFFPCRDEDGVTSF